MIETTDAAAGTCFFGLFEHCMIGTFGGLDLVIDPYTNGSTGVENIFLSADGYWRTEARCLPEGDADYINSLGVLVGVFSVRPKVCPSKASPALGSLSVHLADIVGRWGFLNLNKSYQKSHHFITKPQKHNLIIYLRGLSGAQGRTHSFYK